MQDLTRVITLGIGPMSDIAGLVLTGLNTSLGIITPGCARVSDALAQSALASDALIYTSTESSSQVYTIVSSLSCEV